MQDRIKMNGTAIFQPDSGLGYGYTTSYGDDNKETQDGVKHGTVISTHESLTYTATGIPCSAAATILQIIAHGGTFTLHYYSVHLNTWRNDTFRVPQTSISIGSLIEGGEMLDSLSFTMEGVHPI